MKTIMKDLLAVKAERMECNVMTEAASGDRGGSKRALPVSKAVATYVAEGTSLRTTQGVGVCF